jgi:RNA polymerase sigma-70 factor (ECF subfamily)
MAGGTEPVDATLSRLIADDHGRILAALIGQLRDFQLAEDCLQDACASALEHWHRSGIPRSPRGWILTTARRKAIDRLRRHATARRIGAEYEYLLHLDQSEPDEDPVISDERLRLIFTCCHPALDPKSRVALTLRTLGGLTTPEIARAFLDSESTMGQRLSRAKAKIAAAGIPFAVPDPEMWPERLQSVLTVIYLIFNEGCSADPGDAPPRVDLCGEAIYLGRMLVELRPDESEALGLLSLMLTTHARRPARFDPQGVMIPLAGQNRDLWDRGLIGQGLAALDDGLRQFSPGPFQIKAAMSALHVRAARHAETDWRQMLLLYDALLVHEPSVVVRLNRAVAQAEAGGLTAALAELAAIEADLAGYQPFFAAKADLLARAGQIAGARAAYDRAIALSGSRAEQQFLAGRRDRLGR